MSINSSSLAIKSLSNEAYQFDVEFFQQATSHSVRSFVFTKSQEGEIKEMIDLYSLNCTIPSEASKVLTKKDIKHLKNLPKVDAQCSTILTLDMRDTQLRYTHPTLAEEENKVCPFLSRQHPLDFIYCEGSLKSTLLHQFSEQQADYLNSKKGSLDFCQLAEVFMNAAKFGHEQQETMPEQYIYCGATPFRPHQKSTIWYPPLYKDSIPSVVTLFQPVFSTDFFYNASTGMTHLSMEKLC